MKKEDIIKWAITVVGVCAGMVAMEIYTRKGA